jgi:hypothetical protein
MIPEHIRAEHEPLRRHPNNTKTDVFLSFPEGSTEVRGNSGFAKSNNGHLICNSQLNGDSNSRFDQTCISWSNSPLHSLIAMPNLQTLVVPIIFQNMDGSYANYGIDKPEGGVFNMNMNHSYFVSLYKWIGNDWQPLAVDRDPNFYLLDWNPKYGRTDNITGKTDSHGGYTGYVGRNVYFRNLSGFAGGEELMLWWGLWLEVSYNGDLSHTVSHVSHLEGTLDSSDVLQVDQPVH